MQSCAYPRRSGLREEHEGGALYLVIAQRRFRYGHDLHPADRVADDPSGRFFPSVGESGDAKLAAALQDGRLKPWSFSTAMDTILAVREPQDLGLRVVVCIDLEPAPTARGEVLLASLVELARLAHCTENLDLRYALVTLGSGEHRYTTVPRTLSPVVIRADAVRPVLPAPTSVWDAPGLNIVAQRIMADLQPDVFGGEAGVALLYLNGQDWEAFCSAPCVAAAHSPHLQTPIKTITVTKAMLESPSIARTVAEFEAPGVVHVNPSITITLPFRNVRAVISSRSRVAPSFDPATGLYARRGVATPSEATEADTRMNHAKPFISAGGRPTLAWVELADGAAFDESGQVHDPVPVAYGDELLLVALLAFTKWPDRSVHEMPLLHPEAPSRAGGSRRHGACRQWVVVWLKHVRNWRVACFLAHIKRDLPVLSKRTFIHLAAIIKNGVPLAVGSPGMSRKVMREVMSNVPCGPAAPMVPYGQVLVALSLWERRKRDTDGFAEDNDSTAVTAGRITLYNSVTIHELVLRLEAVLGLPAATREGVKLPLPEQELCWIQHALADSWLTKLIWIPKGLSQRVPNGPYARCAAYGSVAFINEPGVATIIQALLDHHSSPGLHAVALSLDQDMAAGAVDAENIIVIDKRVIASIANRVGLRPSAAFASRRAHGGR
ncbi:hypothetical protein N658DRAFT_489099 [Parathielavia hyrcaniae]|uniref:Uncharacterized protein n=1 Tax=Parathielavia hyrcaniae TaxID=113614 RepID=A0AAN6SYK3_9PEZI|nr:hypothetical protein N658DRAFT_489099 [Parathielavia hyrcaniae]